MLIEAEKSHEPPPLSWRPKKAGGVVCKAWEPEHQCCRFQAKSEGLRTKSAEDRRRSISQLSHQMESEFKVLSPFCSMQATCWGGWYTLLRPPVQMLISSGNILTDNPKQHWTRCLDILWFSQADT